MVLIFKKWVKNIQTAGYNGARTVYPFWINEVSCWSDLKSLNGPVGTENRGVVVFTHRDITQLNESTFLHTTFLSNI